MKGLGIIAEYNPFHNGHSYHIKNSIQQIQPDFTVAFMSGNWVQRGQPAIIDKWTRAEMALAQGVDLVIELPFLWATQSAQEFSRGAISLLNSIRTIRYQSFGSETGELEQLKRAANLSFHESSSFQKILNDSLKDGMSYSQAIAQALGLAELDSNDILGIEYLKAHMELSSTVTCIPIKRKGSSYNDELISGVYSSATAIRSALKSDIKNISTTVPITSYDILSGAYKEKQLVYFEDLEQYILYKFKVMDPHKITELMEWEHGLENRIQKAAIEATSLSQFMDKIKTKRYTRTRLNRMIIHSLFELTKSELEYFNKIGPPYLRILGMNSSGRQAIREISDSTSLPILTRPGRQLRHLSEDCRKCFHWEVKATAFYNLILNKKGDHEFTRSPIIKE